MARPKGSKDVQPRKPRGGAKAADGRPITTDHNKAASIESLTDDQLHALTARSASDYAKALALKKAASADFLNVCKRIKADGVSLKDVETWLALETPEGERRIKERMEANLRIAAWRGADLGTQFTLFRDDGEEGTEENASYKAGKEAGVQGESAKPPRQWDSAEWMRGHGDGQALNLSQFKQKKEAEEQEFEEAAPTAAPNVVDINPATVGAGADDDEF